MSKYGIILKVGKKYLYMGMTREAQSTELMGVESVPKDWMNEEVREPGLVLDLPGSDLATEYAPGGPGGGGRQVPIQHDLLDLYQDILGQTDADEWSHPPVEGEVDQERNPAEEALDLLEKPVERERTARAIIRDYKALKAGRLEDIETVPEVADIHNVHVRTLYRVVKERLTEEDRILPERLVEDGDQAEA
jgi:hypothetical protein